MEMVITCSTKHHYMWVINSAVFWIYGNHIKPVEPRALLGQKGGGNEKIKLLIINATIMVKLITYTVLSHLGIPQCRC